MSETLTIRPASAAMPGNPRILLANEAGAARGHIVKLAAVARAIGPGYPVTAALARQRHAPELAPYVDAILRAPAMSVQARAPGDPKPPRNTTWGDYLAAVGMARHDVVRRGLQWWRKTIVRHDISVLIADYAPLAMRAAQGLQAEGWQIAVICIGNGVSVPPPALDRFPGLFAKGTPPAHDEGATLDVLNAAGSELGLDPLARLPDLYAGAHLLPSTFAFLDPYAARRPGPPLPPMVRKSRHVAGDGDEVFIYFSASELEDAGCLAAVCALPLPRRIYAPGATPEIQSKLAASGVIVEPAPLTCDAIAARTRLIVHAAQAGTISTAALAGLPQVGLPQHMEQRSNAWRAEQQGILRTINRADRTRAALRDAILTAYHDPNLGARAQDFAYDLRAQMPDDPLATLHHHLMPILDAARHALM
jgi:hypothetical protein